MRTNSRVANPAMLAARMLDNRAAPGRRLGDSEKASIWRLLPRAAAMLSLSRPRDVVQAKTIPSGRADALRGHRENRLHGLLRTDRHVADARREHVAGRS